MTSETATHFLNVDLDVKSRANLAPLVGRMERRAVVLHSDRRRGVHSARFELLGTRQGTPDQCIAGLARLIEDLPAAERGLWDEASARIFDIGIQAGADGQVFKLKIKAATLERVAAARRRRRRRRPTEFAIRAAERPRSSRTRVGVNRVAA